MKRADITELFPDASKEQIDKIMSLNGADVTAAKADLQSLKDQIEALKLSQDGAAASATELQSARDELAQLKTQIEGMKNAEKIRGIREKVSGEKKVPMNLLTGETEEACTKQADDILNYAKSLGSFTVPDGGEPNTFPAASTRDQFTKWAEKIL
jgi:hypothetical protein